MLLSWFSSAVWIGRSSAFAIVLGLVAAEAGAEAFPPGIAAPGAEQVLAVSYYSETGSALDLSAIDGELIVVNFWASWCVPCVTELPSLGKLRAEVAGDGIEVLALSVDRGGVPITRRFFAKHGRPDLMYGFDPRGRSMEQLGSSALPTTLVVRRSGKVVAVSQGSLDWAAPEIIAWLRGLL